MSEMASIVRDLDPANTLSDLAPIDVARGLVCHLRPLAALGRPHARAFRQRQAGAPTFQTGQ